MAYILSIETASTVCSVALYQEENLVATTSYHMAQSTAAKLAVMIDDLFRLCGVSARQLDVVAVSAGPGSYTGLRIGVATAKGLCYGLNVPLVSINTLEAMAYQVLPYFSNEEQTTLLAPMLDARRMEVYTCLFDVKMEVVEPTQAKIIDNSSYIDRLAQARIVFFGEGATKCRSVIHHENAVFLEGVVAQASAIGALACRRFREGKFEDVALFEPYYLKDFLIKTKTQS